LHTEGGGRIEEEEEEEELYSADESQFMLT